MLANSIALVTLAVMLGSEASRASRPWNFGLWFLATIIFFVGAGLWPISQRLPGLASLITVTFASPVAWFVLAVGVFLVIRPFWIKPVTVQTLDIPYLDLGNKAGNIARRIGKYRGTHRLWRDQLPPLMSIIRDGQSLLMSFNKAGFSVPSFDATHEMERIAVGMEFYFH